ncbi:ShlB/FhaC/HecB family hemolysin secretion/activation protein [Lentilitoribacter sp. EG35]|uniref:ShlB/FhaC/HecB family hemolysin secretion/activation protein n=1 Tax=Lentilitoribacter sp. EG35 TaxID=3234192 RepID=UPI0034601736
MRIFSILIGLILLLGSTSVFAQFVEESQPPRLQGEQLLRLPGLGAFDPAEASDEPLGITLKGVRIISDPNDLVSSGGFAGIDINSVEVPEGIDLEAALKPYLGKSVSFKSLFAMRDDIIRAHIKAGRAFVAGTIPPQEISSGVIQIIVTESVLETKRVEGLVFTDEDYILDNIGAEEGETVDTDQLIADLNWLNLNPYRNLIVIAEPGKEFGGTALTFRASEAKPWSVYGGYNNYGTPATNENRLFAGFHLANIPALDHQLSYQLTMSPEALARLEQPFTASKQAAYLSHDGNYFIPLPWRHKLRTRAAYIRTRSNLTGGLVSATDTAIFTTEYAIPAKNIGSISPEFYGRYEFKNSQRRIYTGSTLASNAEIDVHQFLFGLRGNAKDQFGQTNFDVRFVHSPGGLSGFNNAASYAAFSGNTGADDSYNYAFANIQRSTPITDAIRLLTEVTGQYSNETLPSTEVLSIGGVDTVRGYSASEATGDKGVIIRNELHFDVTPEDKNIFSAVDLYAFFDAGHVKDIAKNSTADLASLGFGLNTAIGEHVSFNSSLGVALRNGPRTKTGDVRFNFNLNARF